MPDNDNPMSYHALKTDEFNRLIGALQDLRNAYQREVNSAILCSCPSTPDGRPDRNRMDADSRSGIGQMEAALRRATAAIASAKHVYERARIPLGPDWPTEEELHLEGLTNMFRYRDHSPRAGECIMHGGTIYRFSRRNFRRFCESTVEDGFPPNPESFGGKVMCSITASTFPWRASDAKVYLQAMDAAQQRNDYNS